MKKPRRNIEKQEAVVGILWEFGKNISKPSMMTAHNIRLDVTLPLSAVGQALREIMATFGYEVVSIQ